MCVFIRTSLSSNEDMARMYEWYETIGTGIDISALHQESSEVNWLTFSDWVDQD
jgi:hypothetical protein